MFEVFRGSNLPTINSNFNTSDVRCWKAHDAVKKCHANLFKRVIPTVPDTYMSKIIDRVWKDKRNTPKIQIALAISVCETILNPNNLVVSINEEVIKPTLLKNIVSF